MASLVSEKLLYAGKKGIHTKDAPLCTRGSPQWMPLYIFLTWPHKGFTLPPRLKTGIFCILVKCVNRYLQRMSNLYFTHVTLSTQLVVFNKLGSFLWAPKLNISPVWQASYWPIIPCSVHCFDHFPVIVLFLTRRSSFVFVKLCCLVNFQALASASSQKLHTNPVMFLTMLCDRQILADSHSHENFFFFTHFAFSPLYSSQAGTHRLSDTSMVALPLYRLKLSSNCVTSTGTLKVFNGVYFTWSSITDI